MVIFIWWSMIILNGNVWTVTNSDVWNVITEWLLLKSDIWMLMFNDRMVMSIWWWMVMFEWYCSYGDEFWCLNCDIWMVSEKVCLNGNFVLQCLLILYLNGFLSHWLAATNKDLLTDVSAIFHSVEKITLSYFWWRMVSQLEKKMIKSQVKTLDANHHLKRRAVCMI